MSLTFDEAINYVQSAAKTSEKEHKVFMKDISHISKEINNGLINVDSIFKNTFLNLEATASYRKGKLLGVHDRINHCLWIKMPFEIIPQFTEKPCCVVLKATVSHPIVQNGLVNSKYFNLLLMTNISKALVRLKSVKCKSGLCYSFTSRCYSIGTKTRFVIFANAYNTEELIEISFGFTPTLKCWSHQNWCAVPIMGNDFFCQSPIWETLTVSNWKKLGNVLCLLGLLLYDECVDFQFVKLVFMELTNKECLPTAEISYSKLILVFLESLMNTIEGVTDIEIRQWLDNSLIQLAAKILYELKYQEFLNDWKYTEFFSLFGFLPKN